MDPDIPDRVNYWITKTSKHDCFFNVGPESGPQERIGGLKIFLMGHSEVLRKMLDDQESALAETGDITVTDTDPETFKNFLKCIYGAVEIVVRKLSFEECMKLMYLCEKYLAIELKQKVSECILDVHQPLSVNDVLVSLLNPVCLEDKNLAGAISKVIQTDTDKIINDKQFNNLNENALMFIANQEYLSTREVNLWKAILEWGQGKVESKQGVRVKLLKLLKSVRFCTMTGNEFCTSVVPSNTLTNKEVAQICRSIGTKTALHIQGINNDIVCRHVRLKVEFEIFHLLHPISTFTETEASKQVHVMGFTWNILLVKYEAVSDPKMLGIFLQCEPQDQSSSWKCCASAEIILLNHFGKRNLIRSYNDHMFTRKESDFGFRHFLAWNELVLPQNGYVKNNYIQVQVKAEIKSA